MTPNFRTRLTGSRCVYCGESADTDEHWPPISCCLPGYLLPACLECNIIASDRFPMDFIKRADFVKERLVNKYIDCLVQKEWTQEEIAELGDNFKREMEEWQIRKKRAEKRIAWNAILYIAYIDHTNDFAPQFASLDSIGQRLRINLPDLDNSSEPKENSWKRDKPRATVYQSLHELAMIKRYQETGDIDVLNRWGELYGEKYDALRK